MRAVDTNLVVRYILAHDDPEQSRKARLLIDGEPVFVPTTVLLECEWVLRSIYRIPTLSILAALRQFAGLPTVLCEDPARLAQSLDWLALGFDFADAIHLSSARHCEEFVTFDKAFTKAALAIGPPRVRLA